MGSNNYLLSQRTAAEDYRQALIDIFPFSVAIIPWAILCGSMAIESGLSAWQAQSLSLFVFAGSAQLASFALIGVPGAFTSILGTTFVINSRHLIYSAVLRDKIRILPLKWRGPLAFILTDQMFALSIHYINKQGHFNPRYSLASGATLYLIWNVATFAGIVLGKSIPNLSELGLEFAIAASFITIVVPTIKKLSTLLAAISSGLVAIGCAIVDVQNGLLMATFVGMVVGYGCANFDKDIAK